MGGSWEFRGKREKDPKLMIYHVPYDSLAIWRHPLICRKDQKRIEKAIIWKLNSESRGCEATNMKIQLLLGICRVAPQQIVVKRGGTCVFFVNTMSRPLSYAWARVDTSMANPGSPPPKKKTCRYLAKPRIENMSWQCQKHVMAHHGTPKEQLQQRKSGRPVSQPLGPRRSGPAQMECCWWSPGKRKAQWRTGAVRHLEGMGHALEGPMVTMVPGKYGKKQAKTTKNET